MRRNTTLFCMILLLIFSAQAFSQPSLNTESQKQMVLSNLSSMPLAFTENRGQWNEKALFKAEAGGATFFFCKDEVAYVFTRNTNELIDDAAAPGWRQVPVPDAMPEKFNHPHYKKESMVLYAKFMGANASPEILGENRLGYNYNYFIGNDSLKWAVNVPNWSSITYRDIYPGIDLKYHGDGQGIKYDFIVNPGADISQIRIKYDGVENLSVTNQGDLEAQTKFGPVYERIPKIYQEIDGQKREVSGHYILQEPGIFGFSLETGFNPAYPVVIDPELVYSTYLGGNGYDFGYGIAVDGSGNAYVTGYTSSTDFPTQNSYQMDQAYEDAFVTKLSSEGNLLLYSTYLGGNRDDGGSGIAVDGSGNAYVTGYTSSTDFPTQNSYQMDQAYDDAFVTKLSPSGNSLLYSTYLGGNNGDYGSGLAVDASANAYVTGVTSSSDFPVQNSFQTDQGSYDAFVAKFSSSGNSLVYSTYLGGNYSDDGNGIAVDDSGNAYIIGSTSSTDFPAQNPYQTDQGSYDAFVTKLSPAGNSLLYSSYLGGNNIDEGAGIAIDGSGSAYVTGYTSSSDFPVQNPYQTDQTDNDAFVTKLSPAGNSLVYSTYLGGNIIDEGAGISIDGSGSAYVTGYTSSTDFPVQNPYQTDQNGNDAFVTKLSPPGNSLLYSTYLGGNRYDVGYGIAVDSSGNAYAAGVTSSSDFPTQNPYQMDQPAYDTFVSKFGPSTGIDDDGSLPSVFSLSQNYPNPFNAQTQINYALQKTGHVNLVVYNLLGQKVASLFDGVQNAGEYSLIWNAVDMPSGIYFARLETAEKSDNIKMVLLK